MKTYVIPLDVTSDDLYAWLHDCIEIAQNELTLLPSRPRPAAMLPRQVPLHQLYRFVREVADWCVGVYESPPEASPPFGVPLLLLGRLRIAVAEPNHVPIGIWRHPTFPLDLIEVAWELEKCFPSIQAPHSPLNGFVRPSDLPSARPGARPAIHRTPSALPQPSETSALSAILPSSDALPGATPISLNGAPGASHSHRGLSVNMLASTQWLVEKIANQPDSVDPEPLYQDWMEIHKVHTGFYPRDSDRSFNKALDSAFRQLGRVRRRRHMTTE